MHCVVMVTGYNQGDWDRLMEGTMTARRLSRMPRIWMTPCIWES